MPQKRREPRVKVEGAEGILRGSIPVAIVDVSRGGFKLSLQTSVRPGTRCELRAHLDGIQVTAQVLITRCTATGAVPDGVGGRCIVYTAGASLVQIDEEGGKELTRWLGRLLDDYVSRDAPASLSPAGAARGAGAAHPDERLTRLVREVMNTSVPSLRDDRPLGELIGLLIERGTDSAAVVSEEGVLVGIAGARQVVERRAARSEDATAQVGKHAKRRKARGGPPGATAPETRLVRDVMVDPAPGSIHDDATVEEAARTMVARRTHRLFVVSGGKLAGMLDAVDLLELRGGEGHTGADTVELRMAN